MENETGRRSVKHKTDIDEAVMTTGRYLTPTCAIAIPVYKHNPAALLDALADCDGANRAHLIVYDDGSADDSLTNVLTEQMSNWTGKATLVTSKTNLGRSHARNRLVAHCDTEWLLFIDADMLPDSKSFLTDYLIEVERADGPALIAGGFSLKQVSPNRAQQLHAAQSRASECLSANERSQHPGRYVFTSNIMVHRAVLKSVDFDDGFSGWGWEDTDWGLRVAKRFPVIHIDNTATHMGLDNTADLLRKYGSSGANFARMVSRNPDDAKSMTLTKAARQLAHLPGRSLIRRGSKAIASSSLPASLRLKALKMYRAAAYAEHMK